MITRTFCLCLVLTVAGCAGFEQLPPVVQEVEPEQPEPDPEPAPEPEATPTIPPAPPEPIDPVAPILEPAALRVAVVLSERSAAFEQVASEVGSLLEQPLVYNLADKSLSPEEAFRGIADSDTEVVIAIGLRATVAASELSTVPVVYCQVFNFVAPESAAVPVKGVSSIPPLSLQLRAWKQLNPGLKTVGTIVGEGHAGLAGEAQLASAEHGIALDYRVAKSDRETLYLFRRLAPIVDGFWLFPDNRVLSIPVLKEILNSSSRYDMQVAVFNPGLLQLGAALSSATVDADIAATVVRVARRLVAGEDDALPDLTPLSEIDVRTRSTADSGSASAWPLVGAGAAKGTR